MRVIVSAALLALLFTGVAVAADGEIAGDKAAIQAQKEEMKTNASTAKAEEKALKEEIKAAKESGDAAAVQQLKSQLKETHQANILEKKEDKAELREARQDLKQDVREAGNPPQPPQEAVDKPWEKKADTNKDGVVDQVERDQMAKQRSAVDKPWEAKADANKDGVVDKVENKQYKHANKEGQAKVNTKWENKADKNNNGIVERAEARHTARFRDNDNNPPGAKGGPGTNWENKPGPQGGAGASPNTGGGRGRRGR